MLFEPCNKLLGKSEHILNTEQHFLPENCLNSLNITYFKRAKDTIE